MTELGFVEKGGLQTQEAGFRNLFNFYTILEEKRSGLSCDNYRDGMLTKIGYKGWCTQKISDEKTIKVGQQW